MTTMSSIFDKIKFQFNSEIHKSSQGVDPEQQNEKQQNPGWEWYDPPQDSAPVRFCTDTSLHGLQYIGQKNRHLGERLFWLIACTAAMIAAIISIWHIWRAYIVTPIVTVFNPTEITLDQIPFPAVTICNVNNFQNTKVSELKRKAMEGIEGRIPDAEFLNILARFRDIHHVCESTPTFTERFTSVEAFGPPIDQLLQDRLNELGDLLNPIGTIRNFSQSCEDMILFCMWRDKKYNCSHLFSEVETDYGICCTFNTIPLSLLTNNPVYKIRDDPQRVAEWKEADVTLDKLVDGWQESTKVPLRQRHAGRGAGLSILLDPDLDEYYCANSDSEGFVVTVNLPLNFPRIKDNGIAVRTNSEVFVSVRPEITMADEGTEKFPLEKRKCYFDNEFQLPHYTKYTLSNCMDECIAMKTNKTCGCLRYYMPHGKKNERMCTGPDQYNCTVEVREEIVDKGLEKTCRQCLPTCTEIEYHTGSTSLEIKKSYTTRLFEAFPQHSKARNVSIVHVFFKVDSTVPKLRTEMMSVLELISNAGGLLGLCMGFSMLSLLEIIYYATIRLCCNKYRENSSKCHGNKNISAASLDDSANNNNMRLFSPFSLRDKEGKNGGFPTKLFLGDGTAAVGMSKNSNNVTVIDEIFNMNGKVKQDNDLSDNFHTPFETDFQKAYMATTNTPATISRRKW